MLTGHKARSLELQSISFFLFLINKIYKVPTYGYKEQKGPPWKSTNEMTERTKRGGPEAEAQNVKTERPLP
jgi:hypothetical protein